VGSEACGRPIVWLWLCCRLLGFSLTGGDRQSVDENVAVG
jgi:hypothetical protein